MAEDPVGLNCAQSVPPRLCILRLNCSKKAETVWSPALLHESLFLQCTQLSVPVEQRTHSASQTYRKCRHAHHQTSVMTCLVCIQMAPPRRSAAHQRPVTPGSTGHPGGTRVYMTPVPAVRRICSGSLQWSTNPDDW